MGANANNTVVLSIKFMRLPQPDLCCTSDLENCCCVSKRSMRASSYREWGRRLQTNQQERHKSDRCLHKNVAQVSDFVCVEMLHPAFLGNSLRSTASACAYHHRLQQTRCFPHWITFQPLTELNALRFPCCRSDRPSVKTGRSKPSASNPPKFAVG